MRTLDGSWNKSRGNLSKNIPIPVHQFSERYHTNVRCYQVENGVGHVSVYYGFGKIIRLKRFYKLFLKV